MANNVITVRKETAQAFLPAKMRGRGAIDLHELSKLAKAAMEGSELSLQAANQIAGSNLVSRLWNSGEMQQHIIQSISYLGDISQVNLGLSAICNDLAAANLEHAKRIDDNHHATNQQLNQVQQLTGELLAHLRRPRGPALLDRLLPALSKTSPVDQDEIQGWLRALTEAIDLQYVVLQENLDKLSKQNANLVESISRISGEIAMLSESLRSQILDAIEQFGLLTIRVTANESESGQRADKTDATVRKLHEFQAAALIKLNQQLLQYQSEFQTAIQSEQAGRNAMQQSVLNTITQRERTILAALNQREGAIRKTLGELNQHLIKKMLLGLGGVLALQILGFWFLALKMGLFK